MVGSHAMRSVHWQLLPYIVVLSAQPRWPTSVCHRWAGTTTKPIDIEASVETMEEGPQEDSHAANETLLEPINKNTTTMRHLRVAHSRFSNLTESKAACE
jgi:hypothetical protein